jgi:hypothetical protein
VPLSTKYDVWLTDLTTGVGQVIGSTATTSLAAPAALSPGHSYRWWVRADSSDGTSGPWSAAADFAIAPPVPVPPLMVSGISPKSGLPGALVEISGTGFQAGSQVFFGEVVATVSGTPTQTTLDVIVPALPAGPVDVKVANPDGQQAILPGAFELTAPPPRVIGVSPGAGVAPGTFIQISGSGFQSGSKVFFGDVPVPLSGAQTATVLTVVAPTLPAGPVDVKVVNPDGQQSILPGGFDVSVPPPMVNGVSPNSGVAPGTTIQIVGTGFQSGSKVFFGGVPALPFPTGTQTATILTVVTPALPIGTVDVKVVNPDGQYSVLAGAFFAL